MRNQGGYSLGFGFVCFKLPESAMRAVSDFSQSTGGVQASGLYVRQALKKEDRKKEVERVTERYKNSMVRYNLYFKNVPNEAAEKELKEYFDQFGEIKSLKLMRKAAAEDSKEEGKSLGFGFVSYTTIESALRARTESRLKPFLGSSTFTVCQFESKSTRLAHMEETRDKLRLDRHKKFINDNIPTAASSTSSSTPNVNHLNLILQLIQVLLMLKQMPQ
jgi:RNA recognition motif-containing protein